MAKNPTLSVILSRLSKDDRAEIREAITMAIEDLGFTVSADQLELTVTKKQKVEPQAPLPVKPTPTVETETESSYMSPKINDITPYCTYRIGCHCALCSFSYSHKP